MVPRPQPDAGRVVDIRRVQAGPDLDGGRCSRCGADQPQVRSWWATFAHGDGDSSTVVLCGTCLYAALRTEAVAR